MAAPGKGPGLVRQQTVLCKYFGNQHANTILEKCKKFRHYR